MQDTEQNEPITPQPNDTQNLATAMTEEELTALGERVVESTDQDLASRAEWEKRMATALELFAGVTKPKDFPWPNASNVHIPMVGVACFQFQARAYEALILKETARCYATDGKAIQQAERCTKFLNYQLSYQMDEWEEEMDTLLLMLPIFGSAVKKTYWDFEKGRPASRLLHIADFVAPYGVKRLADSPRNTHVINMRIDDIKRIVAKGAFINTDVLLTEGQVFQPADNLREIETGVTGIARGDTSLDPTRTILEQHCFVDINRDGIGEPVIVWVDRDTKKVLRIETRLYADPVTAKQEVAEYFTEYTFLPNPASWMGIGMGHLLEGLNLAANSLINQIIDAGTLANLSGKTGFISRQYGGKRGQIDLQLGQWTEVDVPIDDLRKAIYPLTFNDASPTLFHLLGLLDKYGKEIASLSESILGKLPPSDTTATTMLTVMEQGLKVFSTIHKRIHRSLGRELRKIFYLNSLFLDENVYFMVQDSQSSSMVGYQSGRLDFMNNVDVIPTSDPNITSRAEKLAKAQQAYQAMAGNPLVMNNPIAMYELTKDYLEAMEVANIDRLRLKHAADVMLQQTLAGLTAQQGGQFGGNGQPDIQGGLEAVASAAGNAGILGATPAPPTVDEVRQLAQGKLVGQV